MNVHDIFSGLPLGWYKTEKVRKATSSLMTGDRQICRVYDDIKVLTASVNENSVEISITIEPGVITDAITGKRVFVLPGEFDGVVNDVVVDLISRGKREKEASLDEVEEDADALPGACASYGHALRVSEILAAVNQIFSGTDKKQLLLALEVLKTCMLEVVGKQGAKEEMVRSTFYNTFGQWSKEGEEYVSVGTF